MYRIVKINILVLLGFSFYSCNTLLNSSTTKLEIVIPGKIKIPQKYSDVAIRYNKSNVSLNPYFAKYSENDKILTESVNTDSIASELYFNSFRDYLSFQEFFDTIIELENGNFSDVQLNDSLILAEIENIIYTDSLVFYNVNPEVANFNALIYKYLDTLAEKNVTKFIDPKLGLYSEDDLNTIADTTGATLLLSFDYFASTDGIISPKFINEEMQRTGNQNYKSLFATEKVYIISGWNFYDLEQQELLFFYLQMDSVSWIENAYSLRQAINKLPPRKEAVYASAEMVAERFVEYLVPHWIEVERMYYTSGHIELKKTEELINQNKWLEAAEIWKKNVNNKNKSIAAKSMFNMALACEINGDLDAAIDWAVKSFHVFGQKNEVHAANCQNYINILGLRKTDFKRLESVN